MINFIKRHKRFSLAAACSGTVLLLFAILMKIGNFAPFGIRTFACSDAYIQYVDFFAYLKDVLCGKNSISYTLSEALGKDTLTTFSYYLSSPLNLLVVFFKKSQIYLFFNIIVVIKHIISGFTISWFISSRFSNKVSPVCNAILSLCYVFSHYTVVQSSNVMWLDALYLLPIMILGVYYALTRRKTLLLTVSTAACILFNWYAAGISCLLTIAWFIFELALMLSNSDKKLSYKVKDGVVCTVYYGIAMLLGVMISAVLFLPTVYGLLGGKGASAVVENIFTGNVFSIIGNWRIGAIAAENSPSLFCGIIPFIACVGFFLSHRFSVKKKVIYGVLLFFALIVYFWRPLFWVFSLLNLASSYWYRYAFISIFIIIFIAASFFEDYEKDDGKWMPYAGIGLSLLLLAVDYFKGSPDMQNLYCSVVLFSIISIAVGAVIKRKGLCCRFGKTALLVVVVVELLTNANILFVNKYSYNLSDADLVYQQQQQQLIDDIKQKDGESYRISQSDYRCSCSFNEAMAYGYWSPASYTSSPDMQQLDFLNNIGYWKEGNCITVVHTPLVSADALLGVKYVLAKDDINGLVKSDDFEMRNGKQVYVNPYCLPMSFTVDSKGDSAIYKNNPFLYQNELYSRLVNEQVLLFKELQYEVVREDEKDVYTIAVPEGNYALYGNMSPARTNPAFNIDVNGKSERTVGAWLCDPLFYIPVDEGDKTATLTVNSTNYYSKFQLYALDLDELERVTSIIKERGVKGKGIGTDKMKFEVKSDKNESLVLSIPESKGWTVTVNGKKAKIEKFGDCLMTVPLEQGDNTVEFKYNIPGIKAGIIITVIGIIALALWQFINIRYIAKGKIKGL